jgi:ABC-type glycerol-3-phosphate transport system permease component|tara:strand:+ start:416 stop:562 length:147 start_codon:yes stop_codon:yes gene_type:complete
MGFLLASVFIANISILSAAGILTLIPGVIFVIFVRKHLARGFSMGRVG